MASPFPGMDPYLEGEMWQEFHERFASEVSARLMPELRPKYVALLAKRYVLDRPFFGIMQTERRTLYPDVHIVRPPVGKGRNGLSHHPAHHVGVAVMEPTAILPSPMIENVPVLSIEIRDIAERRLVTLIEILSPVNKRGEGFRDYSLRRIEILQTATHLLEIDLLSQGNRIELLGTPPEAPYYIYLSRVEDRPDTEVWALPLQQPLPAIAIPLLAPDPDIVLDLQAAIDGCFDLVGYEQLLDYDASPPTTLSENDQQWAIARLKESGWRN